MITPKLALAAVLTAAFRDFHSDVPADISAFLKTALDAAQGSRYTEQQWFDALFPLAREMIKSLETPSQGPERSAGGAPGYTPEQKAAAFDALWENCGKDRGQLIDFVSRDISRPGCPPNEATFLRVPRYEFTVLAEGEGMRLFRDVLHHLATRRR